ncbi:MAG: (2Fe-2S)-binding protein [Spirochaetales bacterium]|nr:(2Fe-2S)-binding protein [Spirochaetales bacterium]
MKTIILNGNPVEAEENTTVLTCAQKAGVRIPTLCYHKMLSAYSGCRVCLVEVSHRESKAPPRLMPACSTIIDDNMVVDTESETVKKARVFIIELMLSRCPDSEVIRRMAEEYGVFSGENDDVVRDYLLNRAPRVKETNCVLCGLCVRVCAEITERHALSFETRGVQRVVTSPFRKVASKCIGCGSCAYVCPTKTITVEEAE